MTIILDTFIKAIWISCMAFCPIAFFISWGIIVQYCPPKAQYHDTLSRTLFSTIKNICGFVISAFVWLYILDFIFKLGDSILFDPASFHQVYLNVLQQMDEWKWLAYGLAAVFYLIWWKLAVLSSPNIMDRVRSKKPHPITTTKERIKAEILEVIGTFSPFILIAISPIIIIPLYMLIFGWLLK